MTGSSVLTIATREGISATLPQILGIAVVVGLLSAAIALLWTTATGAQARSDGDLDARLRALDELVTQGSIGPEDYERARSALLREI